MDYKEFLIKAFENKSSDEYKYINEIRKKLYGLIETDEPYHVIKRRYDDFYYAQCQLFKENYLMELPPSEIRFKNLLINCNTNSVHDSQTYLSGFDDEFLIFDLYDELLKSDSNVIDVGANVGGHTCVLSKICLYGNVYSIEPIPINVKKIKDNLRLNNLIENVNVIEELIYSEVATVKFNSNLNNFNKGVGHITNDNYSSSVETNTLDNLNIKEKIDLIKIDVEGQEIEILKGAKELLMVNKPIIIIEYNQNQWKYDMLADNIPYDFDVYRIPNTKKEKLIQVNNESDIIHKGLINLLVKPKSS